MVHILYHQCALRSGEFLHNRMWSSLQERQFSASSTNGAEGIICGFIMPQVTQFVLHTVNIILTLLLYMYFQVGAKAQNIVVIINEMMQPSQNINLQEWRISEKIRYSIKTLINILARIGLPESSVCI